MIEIIFPLKRDYCGIYDQNNQYLATCSDPKIAAAIVTTINALREQNAKLVADLDSYSQMCGDIVTYGTTADVLDQHLKEAYDRIKQLEQTIRDLS